MILSTNYKIETSSSVYLSSTFFEDILDYTSKIINLKEDAKLKINRLLSKYNKHNSELSKNDVKLIVEKKLNQILNEKTNYEYVSLCA